MSYTIIKKENISLITLSNNTNFEVTLSSIGASIYDIKLNNKSLVLTPSDFKEFITNTGYNGKTVGRYSGRISHGECKINDTTYFLDLNDYPNSLHGGFDGLSYQNFDYEVVEKENKILVIFRLFEKENKLPGDVKYKITYTINFKDNSIKIHYDAISTKDTLMNLTNHTYFNLSYDHQTSVMDHSLKLYCNKYTKLDNTLITTDVLPVNKVMDFTKAHKVKKYINDESLQNHKANGYDHCFIKTNKNKAKIATFKDNNTKVSLDVYTSYPTIVVYACNYPSSALFLPNNDHIAKHYSLCLECQYIPNGINMENEDSAILKKNTHFNEYIKFIFKDGKMVK